MSECSLSIVLPCLNEEENIRESIGNIQAVVDSMEISYEIVVVDNGSIDHTAQYATEKGARVVTETIKGYGAALQAGFREAKGDAVVYFDPDGSYDPKFIPALYTEIKKGNEMVLGTRIGGTIAKGAMPWLHQYLGTPVLTWCIRVLFGSTVSDCNSGFRMFKKKSFDMSRVRSVGMEFASEVCVEAAIQKLKYKEVPIVFVKDQRSREPHLRTWRDGTRHLLLILRKRVVR